MAGTTLETTRERLLTALAREGIVYPPARLDEAVEDCAELLRFIALIRVAAPDPLADARHDAARS